MDSDSRFLDYLTKITQVDIEACIAISREAYEYSVRHEHYEDAALMIMTGCRRLRNHKSRADLIRTLASHDSWKALLQVNFFLAWLADSDLGAAARPRLGHDDSESRWIDTEDSSDEKLFSTCRVLFSDLEKVLDHHEGRGFGGMNLLFFLNRSRRSHGSTRIYNAASFGLRYVSPASDEEQDSILGRVERGQIKYGRFGLVQMSLRLTRSDAMYWIDLELENKMKLPQTIVIPKGTTFEVEDPALPEQSLVVAQDIPVTIPPGVHVVKVPAYCLNRELSPPDFAPGRLTPFRMVAAFNSQDDVWATVNTAA